MVFLKVGRAVLCALVLPLAGYATEYTQFDRPQEGTWSLAETVEYAPVELAFAAPAALENGSNGSQLYSIKGRDMGFTSLLYYAAAAEEPGDSVPEPETTALLGGTIVVSSMWGRSRFRSARVAVPAERSAS